MADDASATVAHLEQVPIFPSDPERFRVLLGDRYVEIEAAISTARRALAGRAVWHINSTATGGGVAEMLQSLLAYARGAGADMRWVVIAGDAEFFRITKRIHNRLHDSPGDGGELGKEERASYQRTLAANAVELSGRVRAGDVVYLHDPQTAGLTDAMRERGALVVWRCHVGVDRPGPIARSCWDFLRGWVRTADAIVFSRREFAWTGLDPERIWIVPPSIDAFSPKNQDMDPDSVEAILATAGIAEDGGSVPAFVRHDGSPGRVNRVARVEQIARIPRKVPVVAQVSRWDRLKDPIGVLRGFADHCRVPEAHLVLAGPQVEGVSDDPEGAEVLAEVRAQRESLPAETRARTHLASLPMDDVEENAAMVNAIQRRADVVVQKSIAEGFGLTVAEAMWKARPVVASRVGGIRDQIVDGESGVLLDDPADLAGFGGAVTGLLRDPDRAHRIGEAGRQRVGEQFLGWRHLLQYVALLSDLLTRKGRG
jgi:trehalose synthase